MNSRLPTYFVSHGGGPWPFMKDQYGTTYDVLEASLADMPRQIGGKPKAVLVVTAHWEELEPTFSSAPAPGMLYDYGGFPPHTYQIQYKAPGAPALAEQAADLLTGAGFNAALDPIRGFDHGTFSMLYPVFPDASVPVVQMSLKHGFDPHAHLAMGRALAPLRDESVLIIGSGLSYHNLRQFGPGGNIASHAFDAWLQFTLLQLPPSERTAALMHWDGAPHARMAHPREEHLLPLMVALGAGGEDAAVRDYRDTVMGWVVSGYRFG
jgi:aromatic ring-opening dioxygenase catalytic subunit (LigB family)